LDEAISLKERMSL